jgi:predicted Zn-dependent peptidase
MESININSNIKLHYIPMKKLKTTTIGVYIHRSLSKEDASKNALLPHVLKRGCQKCKNLEEISKYLENLYGATLGTAVIKRGDDQIMYFDAETISDRFAPENEPLLVDLASLMLSVIFEPITENGAFKAEFVEQEKKNAVDRISALMNDKRSYASLRCIEEMCKGEAFAISRLGNAEDIEKITPAELYEYYSKIITSSVIDIYICGDADIEAVSKTVKSYTDKLEFTPAKITKTEVLRKTADKNDVVERMDVAQGKLSIGFRTNITQEDKDFAALRVFNSVFGAGAHSKLFNNVREKLSLAYYASSQLEKYKGLLVVNAGIEFVNFQKAYDETLVQLEEIQKGNISELEFNSSINAILNSLESCYDDQRMLQNFYLEENITGTNSDIETLKKQIKAVTIEDVVAVSKKLELDTVYFLTGKEEK